jgi:uncharacterized membrane protein
MRHIHEEAVVGAPVEHVFRLACDIDRQAEWNPYMEVRNLSGPIDTRGTTFDSTLRLLGQKIESKGHVVDAEPMRLLHIKGSDEKGGSSDWAYAFEPVGEKTRVTLDIDYETSGVLAGVIDTLLLHQAMERAVRHMAENFKALAEVKVPAPA